MAEERQGVVLMAHNAFSIHYRQINRKKVMIIALMFALSIVALIISLGVGIYNISMVDSIVTFINHISGNIVDIKSDRYIMNHRLPRAIAAVMIGAVLAVGGAVMQNATNNPLAEPYTMGVSSAALLGATLSMALNFSIIPGISGVYVTIVNAFILALVPVAVIIVISQFRKLTAVGIILIGIALMYMFSAISQYIMVTSSAESLTDIYNWRVGSLGKLEMHFDYLALIAVITIPICILLALLNKKLDLMYAGDRNAKTMGLNVKTFRVLVMALVSLTTAVVVSFTGTIGFIGLVGPHVARVFVGSNNKYLLPCAAAFGALFLVCADCIAKVSGGGGLPVGVISSAVGGPLFLYILIKHNKKVWS